MATPLHLAAKITPREVEMVKLKSVPKLEVDVPVARRKATPSTILSADGQIRITPKKRALPRITEDTGLPFMFEQVYGADVCVFGVEVNEKWTPKTAHFSMWGMANGTTLSVEHGRAKNGDTSTRFPVKDVLELIELQLGLKCVNSNDTELAETNVGKEPFVVLEYRAS
jgi:hypothetical protein